MVTPSRLSPVQQQQWLTEHIPHRVRAVLYGIPMSAPWCLTPLRIGQDSAEERAAFRCFGNAAWEGRMSAMRWLIMFVGLKFGSVQEVAVEWNLGKPTDVRIDALLGGRLFAKTQQGADILALMWDGCSKATSHATESTKHPPTDEPHLAEALILIIQHLEATIYLKHGIALHHYTMKI